MTIQGLIRLAIAIGQWNNLDRNGNLYFHTCDYSSLIGEN